MESSVTLKFLVNALKNHKDSWPFNKVERTKYYDYIIKKHMDLDTVSFKIAEKKYSCDLEVIDDINLIFKNCWKCFTKFQEPYKAGKRLEKVFKKYLNSWNLSPENKEAEFNERNKCKEGLQKKYEKMQTVTLQFLINAMINHKDGWPFRKSPKFHKIIKKPMDLSSVRLGILLNKYSSNEEVIEDINLIFQNCWRYYTKDSEEYACGKRLEKFFEKEVKRWNLLVENIEANCLSLYETKQRYKVLHLLLIRKFSS